MGSARVEKKTCARIPAPEGEFELCLYTDDLEQKDHLALVLGDVEQGQDVLVRLHSECFTGDVLGSQRCDCGEQLHFAMQAISEEGRGILLYLRQEGRGIGLMNKLRAYNLQDKGYDTIEANLLLGRDADERDYSIAASILKDLAVHSVRLLTNNPAKLDALTRQGILITERVAVPVTVNDENARYLYTKQARMRHLLPIGHGSNGSKQKH